MSSYLKLQFLLSLLFCYTPKEVKNKLETEGIIIIIKRMSAQETSLGRLTKAVARVACKLQVTIVCKMAFIESGRNKLK